MDATGAAASPSTNDRQEPGQQERLEPTISESKIPIYGRRPAGQILQKSSSPGNPSFRSGTWRVQSTKLPTLPQGHRAPWREDHDAAILVEQRDVGVFEWPSDLKGLRNTPARKSFLFGHRAIRTPTPELAERLLTLRHARKFGAGVLEHAI